MKQPKEELDLDNDLEDMKDLNNSDHAYSSSECYASFDFFITAKF